MKIARTRAQLADEVADLPDSYPLESIVTFDSVYTAAQDYLQMAFMLALAGTFIPAPVLKALMLALLALYIAVAYRHFVQACLILQ